ncbi:MAG: NADPH-dependent assimilatory sulfite reductase hemoprotein subunit [Sphingobium sp.]|jgi:sulfite reductase (NADPH) hemoprotein beta-component|uniref:NADPH-dependent assimilatory sulfite reductase hemoprotein subunit n=2 Tax=Alphaproteobacteria TaxID=28211 RepID=UPI000825B69C|nr:MULTISPECIES: NADPH-dependent assimilatory sulfite reductase hemoprotein subunit [Sphingomonadaceae]MBP8896876.1 NADPH-dependent assimilatory sulfite reductase hemoprotein subunit [Sulfuritalea sp.]MCH4152710.1 NADPH-dependent assimilatory sulfite reductase hemoprotein subunit [Sphingobium sp.]MBX9661705.1 NADPH-dependent assimilatory sulfite reductase hemoprotein subunit [Novosphingobium sp.]MCI1756938.1 NADPH-dependent assimilatory sulfite reductase hemoprotein subunit [Sphingobium sp.]MC
MTETIDRSHDISQALDRLSADERMKDASDYLRGTIAEGLLDRITGAVPSADDVKLMKFHGIYQQDDRDLRDERRRQKLEPAYQFMIRVRLPGGVCTPAQWLKLDELARAHGGETLRITTRQTFQFHWVLKDSLRPIIQGLHETLLDTIAACGDDSRGVMSTVDPQASRFHAEVAALAKRVSDHVIPKTRAYHEIWYGDERVASSAPEELFYGRTYMPRKFKIGFALPPSNDIDVYAQDLGFIAIGGEGGLEGFNVVIGGGMGRTDQAPETYPRLASLIGFVPEDRVIACADAVMTVQRDYGDRKDRQRARFKYTIDDKGLDWVKAEIERVMGASFEEARRFSFASNGDTFGWQETPDGRFHRTIFVENGRLDTRLLDAFRDVARIHRGTFRMTPNQNVIIAGVWAEDRAAIEALLAEHWPDGSEASTLRRNAIACVALPTCGLAMAESERYLPSLLGRIEAILAAHGLSEEPITIRMSGCPNGCSRPYIAEIGLTGRAPGKYNLYLGGGFHGDRLNRMIRENVGEAVILEVLDEVLGRYAREREPGERLGDFTIRAGIVREVTEGHLFND